MAGADTIRLVFAGDTAFMRKYLTPANDEREPEYYLEGVKDVFRDADIVFVNLESTLFDQGRPSRQKISPRLYSPPEKMIPMLKYLNVDVVCLANNHMDDFGGDSLLKTKRLLCENGFEVFGAGANQAESRQPLIISRHGRQIGFLGYTGQDIGSGASTSDLPGCNILEFDSIAADIRRIRDQVDTIIVSLHWGHQFFHYPSPAQIELAHMVIDVGADIIVGHHPHCIQGMERYKDRVVFYSLGDFFFWNFHRRLGYPVYCNDFIIGICDVGEGEIRAELIPGTMDKDNRLRILADRTDFLRQFTEYSEKIFAPDYGDFWNDHGDYIKRRRQEIAKDHSTLVIRTPADIANIFYKSRMYGFRRAVRLALKRMLVMTGLSGRPPRR